MKRQKISDALGGINETYVEEAILCRKRPSRTKWAVLAACLAVVVIGSIVAAPLLRPEEPVASIQTTVGGVPREYRQLPGSGSPSVAIEWPVEYRLPYEKYGTVSFSGREYGSKTWGDPMDESLLGELLGTCKAVGCGTEFEVRQIKGVDPELMVAVDFDGQCFSYAYNNYDPPATFGEVLDGYSLMDFLEFTRFSYRNEDLDQVPYVLEDGSLIREILSACRDAAFVELEDPVGWDHTAFQLEFSCTSESLGTYRTVFYVSENGLIQTNVFGWAYTYDIGTEAAAQIIAYALEHGAETDFEPYTHSVIGTVTEIGDGYILVDDSFRCVDPADGMVFKVLTEDLRIRRYVEYAIKDLAPGDIVLITFTGSVDTTAGNVIAGAREMYRGVYSADGETLYFML